MRPERSLLLFETKAFHTRVEFFSQLLHGRRFHSGPEHSRRAVSREKSDAADRYGEGNPRKTGKGGVNIVGSFLGYFADELERDMNGFGRNPSSRVGQGLELSLELRKLFAKFIWKINCDKDSHYIFISSRLTISSAACDAHQRSFSRSPGNEKRRCSVLKGVATAI